MTNKNTITPAPWEISDLSCCDGDGNYDIWFQIGRSDTGEVIAELNGEGESNYNHIKRNAEFVKTAPELLELLAEVSGYLSSIAVGSGDSIIECQADYYAEKVKRLRMKIGA